ncbi:MAG TPA: TraR/DksA C4-type zinc finger protein [Halalkalibaculum sp.]|nr:TraR/DksA C4-type zinc finger protein [Halalkalibaculum sp.]
MTQQERNELQDIIGKRIKETEDEIEHLKELTKPVAPDNAIGRLSRMDAINNKTINEASLRENKSKLQKLERAMDRIGEERFGYCSKCGDEIAFGRLKFMPWTTKCVRCA